MAGNIRFRSGKPDDADDAAGAGVGWERATNAMAL
jgi:hypothetical protein